MKRIAIEMIALFVAVTAIAGGVGLMSQSIKPGLELLKDSPFGNYLIPGLILAFIVGGSAFISFVMLVARHQRAYVVACMSGVILCGWILGEAAYIQTLHWLQPFYFLLGAVVISLTYKTAKRAVGNGVTI
jgi:hypothetical protein